MIFSIQQIKSIACAYYYYYYDDDDDDNVDYYHPYIYIYLN
jgi:hypothetical protein